MSLTNMSCTSCMCCEETPCCNSEKCEANLQHTQTLEIDNNVDEFDINCAMCREAMAKISSNNACNTCQENNTDEADMCSKCKEQMSKTQDASATKMVEKELRCPSCSQPVAIQCSATGSVPNISIVIIPEKLLKDRSSTSRGNGSEIMPCCQAKIGSKSNSKACEELCSQTAKSEAKNKPEPCCTMPSKPNGNVCEACSEAEAKSKPESCCKMPSKPSGNVCEACSEAEAKSKPESCCKMPSKPSGNVCEACSEAEAKSKPESCCKMPSKSAGNMCEVCGKAETKTKVEPKSSKVCEVCSKSEQSKEPCCDIQSPCSQLVDAAGKGGKQEKSGCGMESCMGMKKSDKPATKTPSGTVAKRESKGNKDKSATESSDAAADQKECTCVCPPAYKQYSCTGKINGICDCTSNDNEE
ncbi:uncharacterized protein LOC128682351 [Plodia interpunctella]|uniref:uncharacterized protein LOC128682351 n=1 Tax=Plodia interpunctella TaxID=58824 RepID=UPI0023682BC6|nr:uncharacterized protein LOC128682351 [Plodia interpunctella]